MLRKLLVVSFVIKIFVGCSMGQELQSDYFRETNLKLKPIISNKYIFLKQFAFAIVIAEKSIQKSGTHLFHAVKDNQSRCISNQSIIEFQRKWFDENTSSQVIEVQRNPLEGGPKDDTFSYVWAVKGDKNFAVELVKQGGCEAAAMLVKEEEEKQLFVKPAIYEEFKRRVFEAEITAKKKEIGIWKN